MSLYAPGASSSFSWFVMSLIMFFSFCCSSIRFSVCIACFLPIFLPAPWEHDVKLSLLPSPSVM